MLMAGYYTVKARTRNSSNNSFVVNNFTISSNTEYQSLNTPQDMQTKDVDLLIQNALLKQKQEFERERIEEKIATMVLRLSKLEDKFVMLLDEVEDLVEGKSKSSTGNAIKEFVTEKGTDLVANSIRNFSKFKK
jgi:hypothetical protein